MADGVILAFPGAAAAQRAEAAVVEAREAHLAAVREWLRLGHPARDDVELEIEAFAATARQMAQLYGKPRA